MLRTARRPTRSLQGHNVSCIVAILLFVASVCVFRHVLAETKRVFSPQADPASEPFNPSEAHIAETAAIVEEFSWPLLRAKMRKASINLAQSEIFEHLMDCFQERLLVYDKNSVSSVRKSTITTELQNRMNKTEIDVRTVNNVLSKFSKELGDAAHPVEVRLAEKPAVAKKVKSKAPAQKAQSDNEFVKQCMAQREWKSSSHHFNANFFIRLRYTQPEPEVEHANTSVRPLPSSTAHHPTIMSTLTHVIALWWVPSACKESLKSAVIDISDDRYVTVTVTVEVHMLFSLPHNLAWISFD